MSWLTKDEMRTMGFAALGDDARLSSRASFHNCGNIWIGNHVRIDDFCVLSAGEGGIHIGDYVHVAVFCSLMGKGRIEMADFSGLSSRVSVYSSNDDYRGGHMTNPTVPDEFRAVAHGDVLIRKHALVGAGSVILPGIVLGVGAAVGALSLVNRDCAEFSVYSGVPARRIGERGRDLLALEKRLRGGSA